MAKQLHLHINDEYVGTSKRNTGIIMKTNHKNKDLFGRGTKNLEKLREELHERIESLEELECSLQLDTLEHMAGVLKVDLMTLQKSWIRPLVASGLSLDSAIAGIVESHFAPN